MQFSKDMLDLLTSPPFLSHLIQICQNTLNPDVLDRCLQLLTALIAAASEVLESVIRIGLAAALADVLQVAAPAGLPYALPATSNQGLQLQQQPERQPVRPTTTRSLWGDDEEDEQQDDLESR